jgi:hypothetical protein
MAAAGEGLFGVRKIRGGIVKGFEPLVAVLEVGLYCFPEEAAGKFAQTGLSGEMLAAVAFDVNALDGPGVAEPAKTLAGGTATKAKAIGNLVKTERPLCTKNKAVDLPIGSGNGENLGEANEDFNALTVKCGEERRGGGCGFVLERRLHFFKRSCHPWSHWRFPRNEITHAMLKWCKPAGCNRFRWRTA